MPRAYYVPGASDTFFSVFKDSCHPFADAEMGTERVRHLLQVTQQGTDALLAFKSELPAPMISSPGCHSHSLGPSIAFARPDIAMTLALRLQPLRDLPPPCGEEHQQISVPAGRPVPILLGQHLFLVLGPSGDKALPSESCRSSGDAEETKAEAPSEPLLGGPLGSQTRGASRPPQGVSPVRPVTRC